MGESKGCFLQGKSCTISCAAWREPTPKRPQPCTILYLAQEVVEALRGLAPGASIPKVHK